MPRRTASRLISSESALVDTQTDGWGVFEDDHPLVGKLGFGDKLAAAVRPTLLGD